MNLKQNRDRTPLYLFSFPIDKLPSEYETQIRSLSHRQFIYHLNLDEN